MNLIKRFSIDLRKPENNFVAALGNQNLHVFDKTEGVWFSSDERFGEGAAQ